MNQDSLPGMATASKKAYRNHDYLELFPGRVFPTGDLDVLERDGNLLFIKSYEHGREIVDAHRKIWKLLVRTGELEGASGHISVVCVWGLGMNVPREYVVFDHTGESEHKIVPVEDWRIYLRRWWNDARRGR